VINSIGQEMWCSYGTQIFITVFTTLTIGTCPEPFNPIQPKSSHRIYSRYFVLIYTCAKGTLPFSFSCRILYRPTFFRFVLHVPPIYFSLTMLFLWFVTPCGRFGRYRRFWETYCLHLQGFLPDLLALILVGEDYKHMKLLIQIFLLDLLPHSSSSSSSS
jgi:hypothetical protein